MSNAVQAQIAEAEEKLRRAMLESDVDALDALIAPALVFTNHHGRVLSKDDDLEAYRSGLLIMDVLDVAGAMQIVPVGDVVVVSVQIHLAGRFGDTAFEDDVRFTRVWALSDGRWQIFAGHSSVVI